MAIPVCTLTFTPIIPKQPFQVMMATDTNPSEITTVNPEDFQATNILISADTDIISDPPQQNLKYLNQPTGTQIIQVRNMSNIPGSWSEIYTNLYNIPVDGAITYSVDVVPFYTTKTRNIRWSVTNTNGDTFGPYIGNTNNIQYIPPGDYTLNTINLVGDIIQQKDIVINADNTSEQIFIDVGVGTLTVIFSVPESVNENDFVYLLISDFDNSSLAENYSTQTNYLESGLYYIVVLYQNQILSPVDPNIDLGIYIYDDVDKTITVNIIDDAGTYRISSIL
jgi:hypothetical protein